jgi:general secretion pathway protein K
MGIPSDDVRARAMNIVAKLARHRSNAPNERGVALIIVLWIFIFLFVVAFNFSATVRDEGDAAHRFSEDTQGYYLAVAGFERGLYEYLTQTPGAVAQQKETPAGFFDGSWREENLSGGVSRVRLIDEGGKINLNRADENLLRRIFTNLGIEEPRRSILVDSILDWTDPDDLHRQNGAESDYYLALSPSYTARNGPFDTVEELLWVRGVTSELFFGSPSGGGAPAGEDRSVGLGQIFTVDSPIDRVNLRTAPAEVIHALVGIPLEKSRKFVEERRKLSEKTLTDLLPLLGLVGNDSLQMFVFTNPSMIAVEGEGRLKGSPVPRRVKGVVRPSAGPGRLELVRWLDHESMPPQN